MEVVAVQRKAGHSARGRIELYCRDIALLSHRLFLFTYGLSYAAAISVATHVVLSTHVK